MVTTWMALKEYWTILGNASLSMATSQEDYIPPSCSWQGALKYVHFFKILNNSLKATLA